MAFLAAIPAAVGVAGAGAAAIGAGALAAGVVGGALLSKSRQKAAQAPRQPQPLPQPQVRSNGAVGDALLARRGARANMRTGPRGAEAPTGKTKLGQ